MSDGQLDLRELHGLLVHECAQQKHANRLLESYLRQHEESSIYLMLSMFNIRLGWFGQRKQKRSCHWQVISNENVVFSTMCVISYCYQRPNLACIPAGDMLEEEAASVIKDLRSSGDRPYCHSLNSFTRRRHRLTWERANIHLVNYIFCHGIKWLLLARFSCSNVTWFS